MNNIHSDYYYYVYIHNWYHSNVSGILCMYGHRLQCTIIHGAFLLLLSPLADSPSSPLCSPFNPLLLTWNPPSCDRIRPPRSQVACKLTSPVPTLSPKPSPLQIPRTPATRRPTKTTSGIIRRLPSGTRHTQYKRA
jgi:hypothetical protein